MPLSRTDLGAMGLASWRVKDWCDEFQSAVGRGRKLAVRNNSLMTEPPGAEDLTEVGITDLVIATLWRLGSGQFLSVTGPAEVQTGADLAFLDQTTSRILLYQAKIGTASHGRLSLKSPVSGNQLKRLRRRTIMLPSRGVQYAVTGRLAIYQNGYTPYLARVPAPWRKGMPLRWSQASQVDARSYYGQVLQARSGSPCGILAGVPDSPTTPSSPQQAISQQDVWPWEFDVFDWFTSQGPAPDGGPEIFPGPSFPEKPPEFRETGGETAAEPLDLEFIAELREGLGVPDRHALHVLPLG